MKRKFFLGIFILLQFIISCKPDPLTNAAIPIDLLDLYYGGDVDNTLDIYLPAKRNGNTRTIILIHGGFWLGGDKSDMTSYAQFFRDQGFACVSMNYRLTNTAEHNLHPAQINDIAKVIEYVTAKSLDWHISPSRFGLMGYSAGAHLALLYTYASNSNGKVKTVVSMMGPTDLVDTTNAAPQLIPLVSFLLGSSIQSNPGAYQQASPIDHVNALTKPTFLVHGKLDKYVPYIQAVNLKAKLDQFNVKNEFRSYDYVGHEITDPVVLNSLLIDIASWFDETLR